MLNLLIIATLYENIKKKTSSEPLEFMLVGLKYSWKVPVGYFLTH